MAQERQAWITLATNDTYCVGALVMAYSLRKVQTTKELVVMITDEVTEYMRTLLNEVFDVIRNVDVIKGSDHDVVLKTLRPEWAVCMTKIFGWRMTEYSKCVYIDSDAMALKNCDELFEYPELSAVPDMSWTDVFNSGVFVFEPNEKTYHDLLELTAKGVSFDRADQGLLNVYWSNWFNEKEKHLSYIYNTATLACFSYPCGYERFGGNTRILHFLGGLKPWEFGYDPKTKLVIDPPGARQTTLQEHLQFWWTLFLEEVQPRLNENCGGHAGRLAGHDFKTKPLAGVPNLECKQRMSHDVRTNFQNLAITERPEKSIGG